MNIDASVEQLYDKSFKAIYPVLHFTESDTISGYKGSILGDNDLSYGYGIPRFVKLEDVSTYSDASGGEFSKQLSAFKNGGQNCYKLHVFSDPSGNLLSFIPNDKLGGGGGSNPGGDPGSDDVYGATGVEYIYKLCDSSTNTEVKPIPDEVYDDPEYKYDDFKPAGWEDHPQGITVDRPIEYISQRKKKNGEWGKFSYPAIWAKWGHDGRDGDGIEYVFLLTNNAEIPGLIIPEDWESNPLYQRTDYYPYVDDSQTTHWSDDYNEPDAYNRYSWVSMRQYFDGYWHEFSEPQLWNVYKVAGKSYVDLYKRSNTLLTDNDLPKHNYILYYRYSDDKFFSDVECTNELLNIDGWLTDPPTPEENDTPAKYLYRTSAYVDIIDLSVPVIINQDDWKGPFFESANGDDGERGTSISVTGKFESEDELKTAYRYYLKVNEDFDDGSAPANKPSVYFKDDKLTIGDGYITTDTGDLWLYAADNKNNNSFDEYFDDNWSNLGKIQGDSAYLYTAYGNMINGHIEFTDADPNSESNALGTIPGKYIGIHVADKKYNENFPQAGDENRFSWSKWQGEDGYGYEQIFCLNETDDLDIPQWEGSGISVEDWNKPDFVPEDWHDTPLTPTFQKPYCMMATRKTPSIYPEGSANKFHGVKDESSLNSDEYGYSRKAIVFSNMSKSEATYHIELSNDFDQIYVDGNGNTLENTKFDISCKVYRGNEDITDSVIKAAEKTTKIDDVIDIHSSNPNISTKVDIYVDRISFTVKVNEGKQITDSKVSVTITIKAEKIDELNYDLQTSFEALIIKNVDSEGNIIDLIDYDLHIADSLIHKLKDNTYRPLTLDIQIKKRTIGSSDSSIEILDEVPDGYTVEILGPRNSLVEYGPGDNLINKFDITKYSYDYYVVCLKKGNTVIDKAWIEVLSDGADGNPGNDGITEQKIYRLCTVEEYETLEINNYGNIYDTNKKDYSVAGWSKTPLSPTSNQRYCVMAVRDFPSPSEDDKNYYHGEEVSTSTNSIKIGSKYYSKKPIIYSYLGQDGSEIEQPTSPIVYPAGVWDASTVYRKSETAVPYVYYNGDQGEKYYVLIADYSSTGISNAPDRNTNQWQEMEYFDSMFAKIGIIENGTIGQAVFNDQYMFSQNGIYNTNYSYVLYKISKYTELTESDVKNKTLNELLKDGWKHLTLPSQLSDPSTYITAAIKGYTVNPETTDKYGNKEYDEDIVYEGIPVIGSTWYGPWCLDEWRDGEVFYDEVIHDSSQYALFNKDSSTPYDLGSAYPWRPSYCVDLYNGKMWAGAGKIKFDQDGSGELAGGKISWDKYGNLTLPLTAVLNANYKHNDISVQGLEYVISLTGGKTGNKYNLRIKAFGSGSEPISIIDVDNVYAPSTINGLIGKINNSTSSVKKLELYNITKNDKEELLSVISVEVPNLSHLALNINNTASVSCRCISAIGGTLYNDGGNVRIVPTGTKENVSLTLQVTNVNSEPCDLDIYGNNCNVYDNGKKLSDLDDDDITLGVNETLLLEVKDINNSRFFVNIGDVTKTISLTLDNGFDVTGPSEEYPFTPLEFNTSGDDKFSATVPLLYDGGEDKYYPFVGIYNPDGVDCNLVISSLDITIHSNSDQYIEGNQFTSDAYVDRGHYTIKVVRV